MTTFVKITRADGEGTVQLLNLDHVLLLEQRERGTVVAFNAPTTTTITVLESVDQLLTGRRPEVPNYAPIDIPSAVNRHLLAICKIVDPLADRNLKTKVHMNLDMIMELLK